MALTIVDTCTVTGGVDTHADAHVAAALNHIGGLLGVESFPTTPAGYGRLLAWLQSFGTVGLVGVEGTGSYGAGLTRHLVAAGVMVVEVDRSDRQERYRSGKSDPLDAVSARFAPCAVAVLCGPGNNGGDGFVTARLLAAHGFEVTVAAADGQKSDAGTMRTRWDGAIAALAPDALNGARIGVLRFATGWSAATDKVFEQALAVLKAQGATLVDITELKDRKKIGDAETLVLNTELKVDLNAYLATTPPAVKTRTLADVIAFNEAHADRELALFGQETFVKAEATKGLDDPAYQEARATSLRIAGRDGIDAMLAANHLDALVSPTMPPAWKIDAANGDQSNGAGAGSLAAVAGYPHLTVPMGVVMGLPVGLSLMGPAWSEARLLGYGYAYEQAAKAKIAPRFLPSIEAVAPVAPLLEPLPR